MEKYGFLPVTAVQYVSLGNEKFILSGTNRPVIYYIYIIIHTLIIYMYIPLLYTCTYLCYVHVHVIPYSSGEGPVMKILSHSGVILHKLEVLPSKRVHGIRLGPQGVLCKYLCTITGAYKRRS